MSLHNKWKMSVIACAAAALSLSTGAAFAQRAEFHGGRGGASHVTSAPAPATQSFSGAGIVNRSFQPTQTFSGDRWRGHHHHHDRDRGFVNLGIGWPWWNDYPASYYATNCWNSDYGYYGYWYNGYCYQYPY